MPEFTTNQWAILFLVLVLGWLLGLISRSGGKKWKRAYEAERDARIDEQRHLEAANARIVELENERPVLVTPAAVVTSEPVTIAQRTTGDRLASSHDDLSLIRGVGAAGQRRLNEEGIYRYADIAAMTPADEVTLEEKLGADDGYIEQERWREQAALLADGKVDEHRATYGS